MNHGRWSFPMVRFLKQSIYKAFGLSLGANWMWSKRNDRAPKSEYVRIYMSKESIFYFILFLFFEINFCLFSCLVLGFTCLHFLLNVSKMWFANLLTTIFTKNWAILFVQVQRNLHVTCTHVLYIEHYLQPASPCVLEFLSSKCPTLFGETCGSWFKGHGMEEIICFMGDDMIKAHRWWKVCLVSLT